MAPYRLYRYRCLLLSITLGMIFYSLISHNPLNFHDCLKHLPLLLQLCVPRSLSFCSVVDSVWTHYFARCGLVTWLLRSVWTLGVDSSLGFLVLFLLLIFHDCSVVRSLYGILRLITRRLFWSRYSQHHFWSWCCCSVCFTRLSWFVIACQLGLW